MPITPFLGKESFDPETRRIMGLAFEMACIALGRTDRGDGANEPIAEGIIELAKAGECNPDVLCERVLAHLRGQSGGMAPSQPGAPREQVPGAGTKAGAASLANAGDGTLLSFRQP